MKRYKIVRYVDAEQMFQSNAEQIVGKIDNLTYGNDGYLVDDPDNGVNWIPKSVFERNAIPAQSHSEMVNMMMEEMQEHIEELRKYVKHCGLQKSDRNKWYVAVKRANQYMSDLQKIIDYIRK